MLTATIRGMIAHKVRLVLTAASISLGVAFLAGTLILTGTMQLAFDQLFGKVSAGTDAVVRTEAAYTQNEGVGTSRTPVAESVLAQVRDVPGVRAAEGSVSGYALLTDTEGRAITTGGGAPTLGYGFAEDDVLRGEVALLSGTAPHGASEVVIDATSARENDIELGSTIRILFQGSADDFTVVGTVGFGGETDLGGTTSAYFDPPVAQRLLGRPGSFDSIVVSADDGVSQAELAERLDEIVPDGVEAVTGAEVAQEAADAIKGELGFVGIMFTVFAAIALFVGSFIIWNTFTMIVTQRSREIALTRAIGATRRQVLLALLTEAVLIGLIASALGVVAGIGVAEGLQALMDAVGFSLPSTSTQIAPQTIWLPMLLGTLVTVVAALVPASRATRVLPVEALREATPGTERPSARRVVFGATLGVVGLAGVLGHLYGDASFLFFGLGMFAMLLGVIGLLPAVVRPLAAVVALPLRLFGMTGEMARQNAGRNPRRTSATAAALMIGLTLVVGMGVFASSLKTSFGDVLGDSMDADLFIQSASTTSEGFSPEAAEVAESVPGVQAVSIVGWGEFRFDGEGSTYSSIDPDTAAEAFDLDLTAGSLAGLDRSGVALPDDLAADHGWRVGDVVESEFAATGAHDLRVAAVFEKNTWLGNVPLISNAAQTAFAGPQLATSGLVLLEEGADVASVKGSISEALAGHPDAKVLDQEEYEEEAAGFINQLLTFVTVMLLLAVMIALLGIVNTLALSVFERRRELGLLRAVGMTRGQVRAMVRWESVVISLIGATAGAGLGIGLGLALSQSLPDFGIEAISVPVPQVAAYVGLAALAGVLAAIGPARSAANVDVLRAVVTE